MGDSGKTTVKSCKEKTVEVSTRSRITSTGASSSVASGLVTTACTAIASPGLNAKASATGGDDGVIDKFNNLLLQLESRLQAAIVSTENRLSAKIDEAMHEITDRLDGLDYRITELEKKHNQLAGEKDELQRINRLSDAVIRGIPELPDESPHNVLKELSAILKHELSPYTDAFRSKGKLTQTKPSMVDRPIIVRFSCVNEKKAFFLALRKHKRLSLRELDGFTLDSPVFVNESLTPRNQHILREALKLLRQNKLASVFTSNGIVYIKCNKDEAPIKVLNMDQLTPRTATGSSGEANSVNE